MSKEMKMADVSCDVTFVDYVANAVKNHDRLVDENAALREALILKEAECEELAGDKKRLIDAMDLQIMAPDAVNSSTGRTVSIENALLLTEPGGGDEK